MAKLNLRPQPDGYGFLYGELVTDTERHRVDILPPLPAWNGDIVLEGFAPDPTHWIVYVHGEEIARVEKRLDLEPILTARLLLPR